MFGIDMHEYFRQPWEQARGMLAEELDQLKAELRGRWNVLAGPDNEINVDAVSGDGRPATRYVANTGLHNKPQWDQVNLANGVKNRLRFTHIVQISASKLLGRRSTSSGDIEEITLGTGLSMSGTTLNTTVIPGSGGWIPLVDGSEPPVFITDASGVLILVAGPA